MSRGITENDVWQAADALPLEGQFCPTPKNVKLAQWAFRRVCRDTGQNDT